jgi:hypothetical protein
MPGPQNGRQMSAPIGGQTTLTDPSLYDGKGQSTKDSSDPRPG